METKQKLTRVEYKVRPVTRYVVTRYAEAEVDAGQRGATSSETKGEFDNLDIALEIGTALCREEHRRLDWPVGDERIQYPRSEGAAAAA